MSRETSHDIFTDDNKEPETDYELNPEPIPQ